jgi:protein-tyrosine phosphatase
MSIKSSFISFKKKSKKKNLKVKPTKSLLASLTKKKDSIFSKLGIKSLINQYKDDMVIKSNVIDENRKFLKTLNKEQLNILGEYKDWFGVENNYLRNNFNLNKIDLNMLDNNLIKFFKKKKENKNKYYFDIEKNKNKNYIDASIVDYFNYIEKRLNNIKTIFTVFKEKYTKIKGRYNII